MRFKIELINGFMIGIEFIPQFDVMFIDIGFFRLNFDWAEDDF